MPVTFALVLLLAGIGLSFLYLCHQLKKLWKTTNLAPMEKKAVQSAMGALFAFCLMLGFLIGAVPYWLGIGAESYGDSGQSGFYLVVSG